MKALILAGGSGTRLWPVSRENKPKQFHAFVGDKTLLQLTFERLNFLSPEDIYLSTSAIHADAIKEQLPKLLTSNLLLEEEGRDTGPAIAFAANQIQTKHGNEIIAVIYADHLIRKPEEFRKKVLFAEEVARKTHGITIIEVKATSPNPNLGYVKLGKKISESADGIEVFELERFVEKPDEENAKKYLKEGNYLWNTGIYVAESEALLKYYKEFAPDIYENVTKDKADYNNCPKISIDYALMEKISPKNIFIIPADLGWSDIGTWNALFDEMADHPGSNYIQGEHIGLETKGSLIFSDIPGKLIVTSGVEEFIIVDTKDALLVLPKSRAGDVKNLVAELRKQKKGKHL